MALRPASGRTERATGAGLAQSLERWTRSDAIASAAVSVDTVDGGSARLAAVEGELMIESSRQRARIAPAPAARMGRVYVAGTADWESKFANRSRVKSRRLAPAPRTAPGAARPASHSRPSRIAPSCWSAGAQGRR